MLVHILGTGIPGICRDVSRRVVSCVNASFVRFVEPVVAVSLDGMCRGDEVPELPILWPRTFIKLRAIVQHAGATEPQTAGNHRGHGGHRDRGVPEPL